MNITYTPGISREQTDKDLSGLLYRGVIRDPPLDRAVARLEERFRSYCSFYPFGIWAPGLHVTGEMRAVTEIYLPMAEIAATFKRILSLSFLYEPATETTLLRTCAAWPDLLRKIRFRDISANPARLLNRMILDEAFRIRFLFALFLPRSHGESFHRYPGQTRFLESRISGLPELRHRGIRCLDAACGTGEGTYDLARLLTKSGIPPCKRLISGCSIEPLEIFAAAHSFFPHDTEREREFRLTTEPLAGGGETDCIIFSTDDVTRLPSRSEEPYDVIICNGLLGGPFMHGEKETAAAISALAERLRPGGALLVSDRFHGGWKRKVPKSMLEEMMKGRGLVPIAVSDGLAAEKRRTW